MKRARYQNGSVVLDRRRNIWYFRWSEGSTRRAARLGTLIELPTKAKAWRKAEGYRLTANSEPNLKPVVTFEAAARKYMAERMPKRRTTAAQPLVDTGTILRATLYRSGPRWN